MTECIVPPFIRRTILHIGLPRTGSTYIQNACEANRDLLRRRGVLYPRTGHIREEGPRSYRTAGHNRWWMNGILAGRPQHIAELREEIEAVTDVDTVLLSSEEMFFWIKECWIEKIVRFLPDAGVTIVVYLRRQDDWLESMYAESVTGGYYRLTASFEEVLRGATEAAEGLPAIWADGDLNYYDWLCRLRARFGATNIAMKPFEEAGRTNDLFGDFLDLCGIGPLVPRRDPGTRVSNATFARREIIDIIRTYNGLPFRSEDTHRRFLGLYQEALAREGLGGKAHLFEAPARRAFRARFAAGNRLVAQEFLGRGNGALFDDSVPQEDPGMTLAQIERAHALAACTYAQIANAPQGGTAGVV